MTTDQLNARKVLRRLANDGKITELRKAFDKTITIHPELGVYAKCSQCETETPHIEGECQICGTHITKKQNPEPPTGMNGIIVTNVQVYVLKEALGKSRAFARIVLNDAFQLTGLRVVDGANGLFVAYPNDPSYKGDDYRSLFYPVTKELRDHIERVVLKKFDEQLAIQNIGE